MDTLKTVQCTAAKNKSFRSSYNSKFTEVNERVNDKADYRNKIENKKSYPEALIYVSFTVF